MSYLSPQIVVEKFQSGQLFVHSFRILRLLFLHNLTARFDHRLHLQLHLTQQLVQFLHRRKTHTCIQIFCSSEDWEISVSHHTTSEVGLDSFRLHILHIQDVQLGFGPLQNPFTVQHALLKVSRLLEQLVLGGDFSQFPLQKRDICSTDIQI